MINKGSLGRIGDRASWRAGARQMSEYLGTQESDRVAAGDRAHASVDRGGTSPMEAIARKGWMWSIGLGLVAIAIGVIVLVWPDRTLRVIGILFGIYLLVSGFLEIVVAFAPQERTGLRVLAVITGALSILLGLLCFRGVFESILLLALWIGFGWLIRGIARAAAAASAPYEPHRGWQIFGGILLAIAGVVVIVSPVASLWTLTLLVGVWLIVLGVWQIIEAFTVRRALHRMAA
jgi:uncharacterized membrane protein HdeD (DUF308 family)